jgi:hypothetical protein
MKYHLCVCATNRLYFFICGDRRDHDYPITNKDCPGLPNEESYISLNGHLFVPDDEMRSGKRTCVVSQEFLERFTEFVRLSDALNERDRRLYLTGLLTHIQNENNAC